MILPFKPRFEQPINNGIKIHSLREDKHNRWRAGTKIHMATGVRTPKYKCFRIEHCVSVQRIEIGYSDFVEDITVKIDGRMLLVEEILQLALNDGFKGVFDFFIWFSEGFEGKIIHWTDYKY